MVLDPLFMFVIMPDGMQVTGAATATLLSNVISMFYYIRMYQRVQNKTVLALPKRIEKICRESELF